jgi:hypothetical protein
LALDFSRCTEVPSDYIQYQRDRWRVRRLRIPRGGKTVSSKRSRISLSEAGQVQVDTVERDLQSHWDKIEKAYGRAFTENVRKSIAVAVQALINNGTIEQNALFATTASDRIREIRLSARQLKFTLNKRALRDHDERALSVQLGIEIKRLGPPRSDLRETAIAAGRLVVACDRLLVKIASGQGLDEGESWKHFIRVMTTIMKKAGLRTGASQSRDKSSNDTPSPFVLLISEIQKTLPADIRRHDLVDPLSLAKKINEARRDYVDTEVSHPSQWQSDSADAGVDPAVEREIADVWGPSGSKVA